MAFQMIHMEIAYRLSEQIPQIVNTAEFILGSAAPDSVHMNPDYNINMKIKSHMFEGCGPWSDTQDYPLWEKNICCFCESIAGREHPYRDYGIGICVHCLTDYWNDIKIWRRLQSKYIPPMTVDEFRTVYYPEARGIDLWLYQNSEHTKTIRKLLSEALAMDVEGTGKHCPSSRDGLLSKCHHASQDGLLINKEDVERQRNHLLNTQYDVDVVDISNYHYLSANDINAFIEFTVNSIAETISGWLKK